MSESDEMPCDEFEDDYGISEGEAFQQKISHLSDQDYGERYEEGESDEQAEIIEEILEIDSNDMSPQK